MKKVKFKIQKRIWIFIALALVLGLVLYIFVPKITQNYFKAHIFLYIENAVDNRALSGVRIEVISGYDNPEGEILYRTMTGAEGKTVLNIPYGEYTVKWYKNGYYGGCQNLQAREKEVFVNQCLLPYTQNYLEANIFLYIENVVDNRALSGVRIEVISGYDNPEGEILYQAMTGAEGKTVLNIPYGEYTVKWYKNEYYCGCQNLQVREKEVFVNQYLLPYAKENSMYILAEWESETDLDLCVYNGQTGRCIGKETTLEDEGSFSYGDNDGTKGHELVYLNDYDGSEYGIYVKGNKEPTENQTPIGEAGGTTVSIYTSNGLLYQKESDDIQETTLWHCADISYGQIKERDEYIFDLAEYAWAARDKDNPEGWIKDANIKAEEKHTYDGKLHDIMVNKFDLNGNRTAHFSYMTAVDVTYGQEYEYDESGNLLTCYTYETEEGELLVSKEEYLYDENGNRIGRLVYESDGKLFAEIEYDKDGNQISDTYYNGDGTPTARKEYVYDKNGNEVSVIFYGSDWVYSRWENEYDDNNNLITHCRYDVNGTLIYKEEHQYDQNGNYISRRTYDREGLLSSFESEYDENGNQVAVYHYNGDSAWSSKYEYDDNNNLVTYYEYDKNGTLVYKKEYQNGNLTGSYYYLDESYQYKDGVVTSQHNYVYDEDGRQTNSYEYKNGELITSKMCEFNEAGECTLICVYNGNGYLKSKTTYDYNEAGECTLICVYKHNENGYFKSRTKYDYVYEYDAVGGMKIFYYYVNGVLTTKTITLFY